MNTVIQIVTFHPEKPCLMLPIYYYHVGMADIKSAVGSTFNLMKDSLQLFGLYQGSTLRKPKRLLQNNSLLLFVASDEVFFFKRLSFLKNEEEEALKRDYRGLELLWFELDSLVCQPEVCPGLSVSQLATLRDILDQGKKSTPGSRR